MAKGKNMYIYLILFMIALALYLLNGLSEGFQNVPTVAVGSPTVISNSSSVEEDDNDIEKEPIAPKFPMNKKKSDKNSEIHAKLLELNSKIDELSKMLKK